MADPHTIKSESELREIIAEPDAIPLIHGCACRWRFSGRNGGELNVFNNFREPQGHQKLLNSLTSGVTNSCSGCAEGAASVSAKTRAA